MGAQVAEAGSPEVWTKALLVSSTAPAIGSGLPSLREAMQAARGLEPGVFDVKGVWALADLLEPVDLAVTCWNLELAEAAALLFGKARVGPDDKALAWLRYAQRAASVLAGPLSEQSCAASLELAQLCQRLGRFREAAGAWEVVVTSHERREPSGPAAAERVRWALCLHRAGVCAEAAGVLGEAWERETARGESPSLTFAISCVNLLLLCGRRGRAAWLLADMKTVAAPEALERAWQSMKDYAGSPGRARQAQAHGPVCVYRRDEAALVPRQRNRHVVPPLGVGGSAHG